MLFASSGSKALSKVSKVKVPRSFKKFGLLTKKHAPEIMAVTGAVVLVGSAIYACKQTIKAKEIIEQANADLDIIEKAVELDPEKHPVEPYDEKDARKDRIRLYAQTGLNLVKLYGPAVIGAGVGFGLIFGAHKVLRNRNAALAVAYSNLLTNFQQYRKRVEDKLGTDGERLLSAGAEKMDISVEEDGKPKKIKNAAVVHDDGTTHSIYARIFDPANSNWSRNPASNLTFLRAQQSFANDKLQAEGYLFLNDVYQMLGFPRTTEGQIVGWIYDPDNENPEHTGDNQVDFGIYDALFKDSAKRDFINAAEPCVWLDFNVDGVMYDLI